VFIEAKRFEHVVLRRGAGIGEGIVQASQFVALGEEIPFRPLQRLGPPD